MIKTFYVINSENSEYLLKEIQLNTSNINYNRWIRLDNSVWIRLNDRNIKAVTNNNERLILREKPE